MRTVPRGLGLSCIVLLAVEFAAVESFAQLPLRGRYFARRGAFRSVERVRWGNGLTANGIAVLQAGNAAFAPVASAGANQSHAAEPQATLDAWITRDALPFSLETSPDTAAAFDETVDQIVAALGDQVRLLGFGEAIHGGERLLTVRNRLFQRLVSRHGYTAIALETSFSRAWRINEYVAGRGLAKTYDDVLGAPGFSQGVGEVEANRELVEWMRRYNADAAHEVKLSFYGFDIPTGRTGIEGPGGVLPLPLDYLSTIDAAGGDPGAGDPSAGNARRQKIAALLAQIQDWENPLAWADSTKSPGRSAPAAALRLEIEDLITELRTRRPELEAKRGSEPYLDALQGALVARQVANFHAALARQTGEPPAGPRGIRDALMADNLLFTVKREAERGKVLAFAHNGHLQRGKSVWPCCGQSYGPGQQVFTWWPAGSQLRHELGRGYAVIGSAVGESEPNGIGRPEAGSLEARLTARAGQGLFIPTHEGRGLPTQEIAALPPRSGSQKNLTYTTLVPQSFTDFDFFCVIDSTPYTRGAPPLIDWNAPAPKK
jgi:erythromycin esterase